MGKPVSLHELAQDLARLGAGVDHAAARVEHRPLGVRHQVHGLAHGGLVGLDARLIGLVRDVGRADVVAGRELDVLGHIDDDGTGTAGLGHVERLVQHAREVVDVLDQPVVLRARARDADGVALLEGVVADQVRRHLAGDAHDGNGIHERVGEAGDRVRRAGARRSPAPRRPCRWSARSPRRHAPRHPPGARGCAGSCPAGTAHRRSAARRRRDSRRCARRLGR